MAPIEPIAEVIIPLPRAEKAPAFLDSLTSLAAMSVRAVGDGWAAIAPAEGAGRTHPYFELVRLADASTVITDEIWAPLTANPPWHSAVEDLAPRIGADGAKEPAWRERLLAWSDEIYDPERPEAGFASLSARLMGSSLEEVPALLSAHAQSLLAAHPRGSFWFMRTDELLARRLTVRRALLTFALMPDVLEENDPMVRTLPQLRTLQGRSRTGWLSFGRLLDPLLLAFSPASHGFVFDCAAGDSYDKMPKSWARRFCWSRRSSLPSRDHERPSAIALISGRRAATRIQCLPMTRGSLNQRPASHWPRQLSSRRLRERLRP